MNTTCPLRILILHRMGDPLQWRSSVRELELSLFEQRPEHTYIVHDVELSFPAFLKDMDYDGIVLGPTFLGVRRFPKLLKQMKKEYSFVEQSPAYKIALPQDDYDCGAILDEWLTGWKIDELVTVIDGYRDLLYPNYGKRGKIRLGYTGYVSDRWIEYWSAPAPFGSRKIDVCYRSKRLPPNFGRIGVVKGIIGDLFKEGVGDTKLIMDISTRMEDFIPGEKWNQFIGNSRSCLTANSGSSLFDPYGEIRRKVNEYVRDHKNAPFEEVERNCFPDEDGIHMMTALSPRNIEAALSETVQIAVRGKYSGILREDRDYLPLNDDASNAKEVEKMLSDDLFLKRISSSAKEAVLSIDALRYGNHLDRIIDGITMHKRSDFSSQKHDEFVRLKNRYELFKPALGTMYWTAKRFAKRFCFA